jgi:hypothetical protein
MKQHLSVLGLAARSTLYKYMCLLAIMAATESVLFTMALKKTIAGAPIGLELLINESHITIVCVTCFLILCVLLSMTGCEMGSRLRYTLQRLSVSEKATTFWWAGYNAVCFLLFWTAQIVIALVLVHLYVRYMEPSYVSEQTIFLAFYRNNFLHSLLPLEETSRYIRNGILILCLGLCSSCFSYRLRHGEKGIAIIVLAVIIAVNFSKAAGNFRNDMLTGFIALCITISAVSGIWKEYDNEN